MLVTIIIIIIVIIIYLIIFVKKKDPYQYHPIYDYLYFKNKFKTGDVIGFSCNKHDNMCCTIEYYLRTNFIGTEFGHSGIILKLNKVYLLECSNKKHVGDEYAHNLNKLGKGGIRIIDFEKLLMQYQRENNATFVVKFISEEIPNRTILQVLDNYKKFTFPRKSIVVLMAMTDLCISHELAKHLFANWNKNQMICSEFVYDILHKSGVLSYYPSYLFWPQLILDGTLDKLSSNKYSQPYKFTIKN